MRAVRSGRAFALGRDRSEPSQASPAGFPRPAPDSGESRRTECLDQLRSWILQGGPGGFIPARRTIEAYLESCDAPEAEARVLQRDISRWNPFYSGSYVRLVRHLVTYLDGRSRPA